LIIDKVSYAREFQMGFQAPCHTLTGAKYANYVVKSPTIVVFHIKESTAGEWALAPWPASGAHLTRIFLAEG